MLGLVSLALAGDPPHGKKKEDHPEHPGVDSTMHFKDGEHDADYDHKAFLGKNPAFLTHLLQLVLLFDHILRCFIAIN